jgi:hypothetical protein
MALRKRERILVIVTGVLVVAFAVRYVFTMLGGATGGLAEARDNLAKVVREKKQAVREGNKAAARLAEWDKRSLPADHEIARSLYQNWLSEVADQVGFQGTQVESAEGHMTKKAYYSLPFTVRGQATMEQLVRFLFQFYQAGHLQQIRHLSIKPLENVTGQENSKNLKLAISIEALSLPGANRPDKLSSEPGKVLAVAALDEYSKVIVGRNLFSPYTASGQTQSTRPADSSPPQFDPAKYAYLTAVLDVGGRPQAWLLSRTTDQTFKLSQGDEFTIGPVHGKVTRIDHRFVELEIDGARYQLALGNSLRDSMQPPPRN